MKKTVSCFAVALLAAVLAVPTAQAGPKVEFGDGGYMTLGALVQPHISLVDGAKDDVDIFLRRMRIIVGGQITDGVKFFADTDFSNAGKTGVSPAFIVQDAFGDVRIFGDHWLEVGLVLLPFSFENSSSAGSPLGIDANVETIKLTNSLGWRDAGAMLHGNFGKMVGYRVGMFDGMGANEGAALRFTGHVAVNILGEVETGWFFNQDRLGKSNYVSLGAGFDTQKDATATPATDPLEPPAIADANAWVVDLQSGYGFGPVHVTLNAAYHDWDNVNFKGATAFAEAGARWQSAMLTLKYAIQDPDGKDTVSDATVGLHYFLKGHSTRAGVEYRTGDSADAILVGMQFLL